MTDSDIDVTARYAAYERVLEYLLTHHLARRNPEDWGSARKAIIGPDVLVSKGITDVDDLERIETKLAERIGGIFDRATTWAASAQNK